MTLEEIAGRFVREQLGSDLDAFPRGGDGLRRLAEALDAWCELEDPGDEADRAFVEGAGALLGVLLIAHVGHGALVDRDGVHRVRLGPRGWFDPFSAIERALDSDDPRAALAEAVRGAEAEARDRGATSRVLASLESALARGGSGLRVAEHFERYVRLEPEGEIDLSRIVAATEGQPESAVTQAIDKLVTMLGSAAGATLRWEEARPKLLPRLVPRALIDELHASQPGRGTLFHRAVAHDVVVALLLSYDDRARYARTDEVETWEAEAGPDAPRRAAVANLAERSARTRFARIDTEHGPIVFARTGDGLDAARLLLPTLHDVLAPELGSPFLVAVPHRDTLLASAGGPDALVEALRARAADDAARAPHRITSALFRVGPRSLRAL